MNRFNERIALWTVDRIGTMGCVWVFLAWSLLPLIWPASRDSVFYVSGGVLQLVLLPLIMVGQDLKTKALQDHATGLHEDLHEKIAEHHAAIHAKLDDHIISRLTNRGSS